MGREEEKAPHRQFGVVATWCSYKAPPCRGDVHGAMATVSGHGSPTGALQRRHSLNRDITGLAKCPPEKQTS